MAGRGSVSIAVLAAAAAVIALACGGGGGEDEGVTMPPVRRDVIAPPLEGEAPPLSTERINYRLHPDFQLPDPAALPPVPEDAEGREYHPPETPECPEDWELLERPGEGFRICYPADWQIDGHGYVSAGADDRWYSLGIFKFVDENVEQAHVSVYMTPPFARPFLYVAECEQAYQVRFDGRLATLCPDLPGKFPEAKIIAYHIREGERDYFVNVVLYYEYDFENGRYLNSWPQELEETAIRIAQSFDLREPPPER